MNINNELRRVRITNVLLTIFLAIMIGFVVYLSTEYVENQKQIEQLEKKLGL